MPKKWEVDTGSSVQEAIAIGDGIDIQRLQQQQSIFSITKEITTGRRNRLQKKKLEREVWHLGRMGIDT